MYSISLQKHDQKSKWKHSVMLAFVKNSYEALCVICYHLYNSKNVKNTCEGVSLLD